MLNWLFKKEEESGSASVCAETPEPAVSMRTSCSPLASAESREERDLEAKVDEQMGNCETIFASQEFDLPTLPGVALKLMDVMQNPNADIKEIVDLIKIDPVLSAKFLRMSNSAYYGGKTAIETPDQAVTRLGLNAVKNATMTIALHGTIFKDKRLGESAQRIWDHSIGTAMVAQEISRRFGLEVESAFVSGLLHDIGKVPALLFVRDALGRNAKSVRPEFVDALVERHHVRAGETLIRLWHLPKEASLSIMLHHSVDSLTEAVELVAEKAPDMAEQDRSNGVFSISAVGLADRALAALGYAEEPGSLRVYESPIVEELNLDHDKVRSTLEEIPALLERMPTLT